MEVFFFFFLALLFIEVPDFQLFVVQDIVKHMLGVAAVLVDLVKILGHLSGLAAEDAEVAVLLNMQFRVDVDEFKEHVEAVGQCDAAPLRESLLDGEHLRHPNGLLAVFLQLVAQIECRPFVGENYGQLLPGEVVVALDVVRQFMNKCLAFAHRFTRILKACHTEP